MRYSHEYKLNCIELYRQGKWPETLQGIKQQNFRTMIKRWVRIEDSQGSDALQHKIFNKTWTPEEKLELISQVLAGKSNQSVALSAGINSGMLYQWVQKYKTKDRLEARKMGCATQGEKAAIIKELRQKGYQLKHLLRAMRLAKSTYYFEINKVDIVKTKNTELMSEIQEIFDYNKGRYGVRRVHKELVNRGYNVNHKRVQRLMHDMKLLGKRPKEKYHSYQGWQYQHAYFRNTLKEHGIIQSMSRKGNCYDNCIMETFFGRLKNEMFYGYEKDYSSFDEFSEAIKKYIDYYNNERIQAKTKWMPPVKYREASMCCCA